MIGLPILTLYGAPGTMGNLPDTPYVDGSPVRTIEVPGMLPLAGWAFGFAAPDRDGRLVIGALPLTLNQVNGTGVAAAVYVLDPTGKFWNIPVLTDLGFAPVSPTNGLGGSDYSDAVYAEVAPDDWRIVLEAATPYRQWHVAVYGQYPALLVLSADLRSVDYDRSATTDQLQAMDTTPDVYGDYPTRGEESWPPQTIPNSFGETPATDKLMGEMGVFDQPGQSGRLIVVDYADTDGHGSGRVKILDPTGTPAGTQLAYSRIPDFVDSIGGNALHYSPRAVNPNPASKIGDERFTVIGDTFAQQDEVQNITITATSGTFTVSFNGSAPSAPIARFADPNHGAGNVQSALEALSTIGAGNVKVTLDASFGWVLKIRFVNALGAADQPLMVLNTAGLSGGTATAAVVHNGSSLFLSTGGFALIEWRYDDTTGTLEPTCAPFIPAVSGIQEGGSFTTDFDVRCNTAIYDRRGNLYIAIGHQLSDVLLAAFTGFGLAVYLADADGVTHSYEMDAPPDPGPTYYADHTTYPDHMLWQDDNGERFGGLAVDPVTGGVVGMGASGGVYAYLMDRPLAERENMVNDLTADVSGWTTFNATGQLTWVSAGVADLRRIAAGDGASAVVYTGWDVSGLVGQSITAETTFTAVTRNRPVLVYLQFKDADGVLIGATRFGELYGAVVGTPVRALVGGIVPEGAQKAYLIMQVQRASNYGVSGEHHHVSAPRLSLSPCRTTSIDFPLSDVFTDQTGVATVFPAAADPSGRAAWFMVCQRFVPPVVPTTDVFPQYVIRVDMAALFGRLAELVIPISGGDESSRPPAPTYYARKYPGQLFGPVRPGRVA